jgi:hypothetical protein
MKKSYLFLIIVILLALVIVLFVQNKKLTEASSIYVWVGRGEKARPYKALNPMDCYKDAADCLYKDDNGIVQRYQVDQ